MAPTITSITVVDFLAASTPYAANDTVGLVDTSANIQSLSAAQISGLSGFNVDYIDATNNTLSLTVAQYLALGSVALTAADSVTLVGTGADFAVLSPSQISAFAAANVDFVDATDNNLIFSAAQFKALGSVVC